MQSEVNALLLRVTLGNPAEVNAALDRMTRDARWRRLQPLDRPYGPFVTTLALAGRTGEARRVLAEWAASVPDDLRRTIAAVDVKTLTRVPGIGQKGAQRIILEHKDRIGAPVGGVGRTATPAVVAPWRDQVHQGLVGLGWPARDAERAVESVASQAGDPADVAALLRAALRTLSKA